jgi:hypothetical protein
MATVSTTRVDLYTVIHKGLRPAMFDTTLKLATFDVENDAERRETAALVLTTLKTLRDHGHHEDAAVMPALQKVAPALFDSLNAEHHSQEAQMDGLEALVAAMQGGPVEERGVVAKTLHMAYNQFVAEYQRHLGREESESNPLLQASYTDAELAAVRGKVMGSLPPPVLIENLSRMFGSANPDDATGILKGLQANAPAPVFAAVCDRASAALGASRWAVVRGRLGLA